MVSVIAQVLYVALWLFFIAMLARLVADWIQVFARDWQPKGEPLPDKLGRGAPEGQPWTR